MDGKHGKPNAKIYRKHIDLIKDKLKFIWKFSVVPFFFCIHIQRTASNSSKKKDAEFLLHACMLVINKFYVELFNVNP
jgi:hypothetical protein